MRRAQKLTIPEVHQGVYDKLAVLKELIARHGFSMDQVAYIGDDVNDLRPWVQSDFQPPRPTECRRC